MTRVWCGALLLAVLVLAPRPVRAVGVGFTFALGGDTTSGGDGFEGFSLLIPRLPTLDLVADAVLVQIHGLDLFRGLGDEELFLGVNFHYTVGYRDVTESIQGVIAPGASFDLDTSFDFEGTNIALLGLLRFGAETEGEFMRAGIYVVPGAGFASLNGDLELAVSGTLQVSMWLR